MLQTRYADVFSQAFCRLAGLDHDNYLVGPSGDSAEMATELADLVVAGIKRASLACDYGEGRADIETRRFRHTQTVAHYRPWKKGARGRRAMENSREALSL